MKWKSVTAWIEGMKEQEEVLRVTSKFLVWCYQSLRECRRKSSSGEKSMYNFSTWWVWGICGSHPGRRVQWAVRPESEVWPLGVISITEHCGIWFQKGSDPYLTYYSGDSVDKFVIPSGLYFLGLLGQDCLFSLTFLRTLAELNIPSPISFPPVLKIIYGTIFSHRAHMAASCLY